MKVTPETTALAQDILLYWERFNNHDQNNWVGALQFDIELKTVDGKEFNVCGTSLCAAGTAVFLTTTPADFKYIAKSRLHDYAYWNETGGELLGLDEEEREKLFYADNEGAKELMKFVANGDEKSFDDCDVLGVDD